MNETAREAEMSTGRSPPEHPTTTTATTAMAIQRTRRLDET
jgi:hypothetical protein